MQSSARRIVVRPRTDLPPGRPLRRDIKLLERFYGPARVQWDEAGRWMRVNGWVLPTRPSHYNVRTTDVLILVPPTYGETSGEDAGLDEFYVRPDLRIWQNGSWEELPHSFSTLDRRGGRALEQGWRYLCVHTTWNPHRDTVMTAMTQLGLVLADPWAFKRLAFRNGS